MLQVLQQRCGLVPSWRGHQHQQVYLEATHQQQALLLLLLLLQHEEAWQCSKVPYLLDSASDSSRDFGDEEARYATAAQAQRKEGSRAWLRHRHLKQLYRRWVT